MVTDAFHQEVTAGLADVEKKTISPYCLFKLERNGDFGRVMERIKTLAVKVTSDPLYILEDHL